MRVGWPNGDPVSATVVVVGTPDGSALLVVFLRCAAAVEVGPCFLLFFLLVFWGYPVVCEPCLLLLFLSDWYWAPFLLASRAR